MLKRVLKSAALGTTSVVALGAYSLSVDAPMADRGDGKYTHEREAKFPDWVHNVARVPLFLAATTVAKIYLQHLSSFTVEGNEILRKHLDARPKGAALITVSNHSATVDDPGVLAAQEYSYMNGPVVAALFYGAKTLPVKRGAGVDHEMLEAIFDKVQQGEWVHIFPEGKICQYERAYPPSAAPLSVTYCLAGRASNLIVVYFAVLGGRESPRREEIGRLKWGVGKLIARAEVRPVVIPFYHYNMEKVMPQNEKNQLISMMPKTNIDIRVRVGEPLSFDDLFEAYEKERVIGATPWETQHHEQALFQAITMRIEDALLELAEPFKQQEQEQEQQK